MSKHLLPAGIHRVPQIRIRECWLDHEIHAMFQQTFKTFGQIEKTIRETRRLVLELDEKVDVTLVVTECARRGGSENFERRHPISSAKVSDRFPIV